VLQSRASLNPARKQFIAIALLTVLINVVFQFLLTTLWSASSYPLLRALSETVAVAVFVVPPAYYFYIRPLYISLTDRHAA